MTGIKRGKRIKAIFLCIVFSAMLLSLCLFAYVHCPCACPCEHCRICLMIHATVGILNNGIVAVYAAIAMLLLADGCVLLNKAVKRRSHITLVALKTKLSD